MGNARKALTEIYLKYRQGLFTLALSITRSTDSAEDAVHDAFERLCRRDPAPAGDLVPYVFAAVRNAATELARRRRRPLRADSIYTRQSRDPADEAGDAEQQALIRQAVESLPEDQRQAVILRIYAGLTFEQMGRVLAQPLPTVAARYRRALERLKQRCRGLL